MSDGRTPQDIRGEFPNASSHGRSAADYLIMSAGHISSVTDMQVMRNVQSCNFFYYEPHDGENSSHFPPACFVA